MAMEEKSGSVGLHLYLPPLGRTSSVLGGSEATNKTMGAVMILLCFMTYSTSNEIQL